MTFRIIIDRTGIECCIDANLMSISTPLMSNEGLSSRQELYSGLLNQSDIAKVKFRGYASAVKLSNNYLTIHTTKTPERVLLNINTSDLIGASLIGKSTDINILEIVYYPLDTGFCTSHVHGNVRMRKVIILDFLENSQTCENWLNVIRYIVSGLSLPEVLDGDLERGIRVDFKVTPPASRHFLVVVNPVGGKRQGKQIWKRYVEPMLKEAGIMVTLLITDRANHARDAMLELEADPAVTFQACLCIGGDGIIFEVVNGIISREGGDVTLKGLPLVHIPGGTGNGLAKSVLFACSEACTPLNATFVAIRGHTHALDIARINTCDDKSHISFLSLAWGLVSDVDILSESMRYLGETRLYVAALYFMIRRRYYSGRLRMKLVDTSTPVPSAANLVLGADGWAVIESPFLLVWSVQTSHMSIHSGPGVRLDDGVFTVAIVQEMSRWEMLELLLSIDSGDHVNHPKVKLFKCTEYTLEPLTEQGIYSLDGEVVPYGLLQAKVLPSAATVLTL